MKTHSTDGPATSGLDFGRVFDQALSYDQFLADYGSDRDQNRWRAVYDAVELSDSQRELLRSFRREMRVLCMAGAWCGDCVAQCPIWQRFAEENELIRLRFIDRDADGAVASALQICGAARVPQVVFLSEDDAFVGRYGDRTLSKYRQMQQELTGAACSTGLVSGEDPQFLSVIQDWLNEFERIQLILRTSPRLRQKHND